MMQISDTISLFLLVAQRVEMILLMSFNYFRKIVFNKFWVLSIEVY